MFTLLGFFYGNFTVNFKCFRWRRQTRLRPVNNGDGLRGDVYYYSPCGKKLRTYPEINSVCFYIPAKFSTFITMVVVSTYVITTTIVIDISRFFSSSI